MSAPIRIAVMASGRGSNFRAINEHLRTQDTPSAKIVLCISNNVDPGAFDYARAQDIATLRLSPRMFAGDDDYTNALTSALEQHGIDMIVLAGYMRKLPRDIVERYRGRVLNIHPALLPAFGGEGMYGLHVHEAVIASGRRESGATVHLVDVDYDTGATIAQERVDVPAGATPEDLAALVLEVEHRLYPRVVDSYARHLADARANART